jgi:hypothetical protein
MRDLINIINEAENHEEKILIIDNKVLKENNPLTNKKPMSLSEYINKQDMLKEYKMKIVQITEQEVNKLPDVFDLNKKVQVDSKDYLVFYKMMELFTGTEDYRYSFKKDIDDEFFKYLLESDNLIQLYNTQPKIQEYIKNTWDEQSTDLIVRVMEMALSLGDKSRSVRGKLSSPNIIDRYLKLHNLIEELGKKKVIPILFPMYKDIVVTIQNKWGSVNDIDENGCAWNTWNDIRTNDICINFNKNTIEIHPKSEDEDDEYDYGF